MFELCLVLTYLLLCYALPSIKPRSDISTYPSLLDITVDELAAYLKDGAITSVDLVNAYLDRIAEVNPVLRAVAELNPEALSIAQSLDDERLAGRLRGPLHGIPILLKDNVATADEMNNTGGSYCLLGATVPRDSTVAAKLRAAGVILLGKTTMSQWSECRSKDAAKGWSAYGGQGSAAYYPMQDPSGSSSGSGIAASIGLALAALGTETGGSIILPSSVSNLVGIKPTVGLTSRSLVIPFSRRQDTVGPMARTVKDAAYILSAIAGKDSYDNYTSAQPFSDPPDYVSACKLSGLQGARIGIPRNGYADSLDNATYEIAAAFDAAIGVLKSAGATIIDNANFSIFDMEMVMGNSSIVLDTDFISDLADYLSQLTTNPHDVHHLQDISACTRAEPREGYPDRDTFIWDRALARNITNTSPETWAAYQNDLFLAGKGGVLGALAKYDLDALIMPSFASYLLPGLAGLPVITVPLGSYASDSLVVKSKRGDLVKTGPNIPFGISFLGPRWSEEKLISFAYAFEQRTMVRRKVHPYITPSAELGRRTRTRKTEEGGRLRGGVFQYRFYVLDTVQRVIDSLRARLLVGKGKG